MDKEALTYGAGHDKAKTIMRGPQAAREAAYKRWLGRQGKTKVLTPFQQKQQAAEAWRPVTDEKTGGTYWYHKKSRETTWETPEAVQAWDQAKQEAVITPERVYDHYLRLRGFMRDNSTMPRELYHRIDFQGSGKICAATLRRGLHCLYKSGRAGCYIPLQETVDITAAILAESGADGDDEGALDDPLYRGPFFSVEQFEIWCTKMEALWTRRQILARNAQQSFYLLFKQMAISKMTDEQLTGQLDASKKGRLTLTNIRASLNTIFEPDTFTDEDADHIFAAIDWDSVGHVELEIWLRRFKVNMQQAVQQEGTKNELEALTLGAGTVKARLLVAGDDRTRKGGGALKPRRAKRAGSVFGPSQEELSHWKEASDPASGKKYWYHDRTKVTTWKTPDQLIRAAKEREEMRAIRDRIYSYFLRLRSHMRAAGTGPREVYKNVDHDGNGRVDAEQLRFGLHRLYKAGPQGCGMTIEEAEDITMGIIASAGPERFDEADKDGFFSMEQMESWCQGQEAVFKRRSALVHEARHGYHTIFRVMLEQGISPEQLFESMDPLSIGSLTTTELQGGLKMAFAPYKIDVTDQEYLDIVTALDFESSGAISATVWAQRFPANAREAVQFVGSAEEKAAARFGAGSLRAKNLVCGARTSSATAIKDSSVNGFGRWLTSRAAAEQLEARRRPVWVPTRDEKTGKPYWYHRITKETSWNEPTDLFEQPQEEEHKVDAQQSYHHYLRLRACMKENTLKPRDVYHRIDFNGDGHIDAAELRRGLHFMYKAGRMGCHISLAEAEAMIYEILARSYSPGDEQLRGSRITVAEFEVWCRAMETIWLDRHKRTRHAQEGFYNILLELARCGISASVLYDQFDVDGSDSISPAEMSLGLARMFRHEFSPYDVQQIFDSLDVDRRGGITRREWLEGFEENALKAAQYFADRKQAQALKEKVIDSGKSRPSRGRRAAEKAVGGYKAWLGAHRKEGLREANATNAADAVDEAAAYRRYVQLHRAAHNSVF